MVAIFQVLFLGCSSLRICNDLSAPCCTSACSKSGSGETLRHTKPTKVRQQRPLVALNISILLQFSRVQLFVTPWTAAHQASLSITNSRRLLKLMSTESVMPSDISSSVVPFSSCPQSLPALGSFPMSQFFTSGGQSIGVSASASVLPMNIQD